MRSETIRTWLLVGFFPLTMGTVLYMSEAIEGGKLAVFLAVVGLIYFGIGVTLSYMHGRHMVRRTRAGRDDN